MAVYIISAIKSTNFLSISAAVSQPLPEFGLHFAFLSFYNCGIWSLPQVQTQERNAFVEHRWTIFSLKMKCPYSSRKITKIWKLKYLSVAAH